MADEAIPEAAAITAEAEVVIMAVAEAIPGMAATPAEAAAIPVETAVITAKAGATLVAGIITAGAVIITVEDAVITVEEAATTLAASTLAGATTTEDDSGPVLIMASASVFRLAGATIRTEAAATTTDSVIGSRLRAIQAITTVIKPRAGEQDRLPHRGKGCYNETCLKTSA